MMRPEIWSLRSSPTPGAWVITSIPCDSSSDAGPTPESCSSCGELKAPEATIISLRTTFVVAGKIFDAGGAPAIKQNARGERLRNHFEIGAAPRLLQIAGRCRGTHAAAHRGLVIARTFLHGAVEIVVARIAALHRRLDIGHRERMPVAKVGNRKQPAGAMEFVGAAFVILRLAEIRQNVVKTPAGIAKLPPMVEVLRLAADINQAVDRTGPAENFAARRDDIAVVAFRLRLGLVAPIVTAIDEKPAEAERDMKPRMPIVGARLQQQHAISARRRQPIGQNAAGAAGSYDDKIERL